MDTRQELEDCSRRLDVLSRRVDNVVTMWHTNPAKAKSMLDALSLDAFRISGILERLAIK